MKSAPALYPLRFDPIFKPAIWGGRRLAEMFPGAPAEGPIGEAWVLSDQGDNVSVVADGPLKGTTLRELMRDRREELLGPSLAHYDTFPLLLKIIDARQNLSVQVHPNDELAQTLAGVPRGKTEAWVVLHAEPGSRIYAGLKEGVDRPRLERAIADDTVADCLHSFEPKVGDCVYLPAGTIHALGAGITIFEVQQTSDTTYRLFDWNRVDAKTGKPRALHVIDALSCIDFARGPVGAIKPIEEPAIEQDRRGLFVSPMRERAERLLECPHFILRRRTGYIAPPYVGLAPSCRILTAIRGVALLEDLESQDYFGAFNTAFIPAEAQVELEFPGTASTPALWYGAMSLLDVQPK